MEVRIICIESKGEDSYYESEGDYPHEIHTINYTTKVVEYVMDLEKATRFISEYEKRNADNPPYNKYKIKLAFDNKTKELINLERLRIHEDEDLE